MKKILIIYSLFIIMLSISCKKYNGNIDSKATAIGNLYIYGRLFIQDSTNGNLAITPLTTKTTVKLSTAVNSASTLYYTQSSDSGYFTFLNLAKNTEYIITAETAMSSGNLLYTTRMNVRTTDSSLNAVTPILVLDNQKQNGILLTIKDSTGLISNCDVYAYSSRQLWLKDTANSYSLFKMSKSNINGITYKTNILSGKYYLSAKFDAGYLTLKAVDSIEVNAVGIKRKEILLH